MSIIDDPEDCLECGRAGLPVAVVIDESGSSFRAATGRNA